MFSKICSRVGRYSHTLGTHGKTHQAQRKMSKPHSQQSTLLQLTQNCLTDLRKVNINRSVHSTLCDIHDKYSEGIKRELTHEYQNLSNGDLISAGNSPEAYEQALAFQLRCALSITTKFLVFYSVTATDMTLEAAISPKHKTDLIKSINDSLFGLDDSDQMTLASAVQPEVLQKLDLSLPKDAINLSIANKEAGKPQLTEDQLLAIVDYCSSATGMFNAVNDGMRVWQMSGVDKLASITSCLAKPLNEALSILRQHDAFVYRGPLYKGINIYNAAGPFRRSKMQPGMEYTSPHWSSATRIESENYSLTKPDRQLQLTIFDAEGVRAHMFNDLTSISQGEVIMPPRPLYFMDALKIPPERRNSNLSHPTIYCTMNPNPLEANGKPKEPHAVRV